MSAELELAAFGELVSAESESVVAFEESVSVELAPLKVV